MHRHGETPLVVTGLALLGNWPASKFGQGLGVMGTPFCSVAAGAKRPEETNGALPETVMLS